LIKLAKPYISEKAVQNVAKIIRSGNLVQGKYVIKFEESLKSYINVNHAILVSSCTAALHLSLLALDLVPGDEVIVPAFSFPATVNVVELVGATPIFVDISMDDFCIDPDKIEKKITVKTKAIIPVHEFGQSADIEKIVGIAKKYKLKIIEDAACALGSEFNGKKVGTFGDVGCFSFHPRKAITTGEGGLIITNNNVLSRRISNLRNHGIEIRNNKIDFIVPGFNYRMTDFQAALGNDQLTSINEIIANRINLSKQYDAVLKPFEWIKTPCIFKDRKMVYQTYHIMLDESIKRDHLIERLKKYGIETNIGAYALNCISYYKNKYNLKDNDFPNAVSAYRNGLALPIGMHISVEEIHTITKYVSKLYNE